MVHLYGLRRGRDRIVVEFTPMQSEPITLKKSYESESRSWRGVLDTT